MQTLTAPEPTSPFARVMAFTPYALYLLGWLTAGATSLIGLIIAYARRDGAPHLEQSHHRFQIRLFWIGVALGAAALGMAGAAMGDQWSGQPRMGEPQPPPFHIPRSPHAQTIAYHPSSAPRVDAQADRGEGFDRPHFTYRFTDQGVRWRMRPLLEITAAGVLASFMVLWSLLAPVWGMVRLASGLLMGHRAEGPNLEAA
jgi:hypothetical protein